MESVIPARSRLALDHKRLEEHTRCRREGGVYSRGNRTSRKRSSPRGSNGGPRRRSGLPREGFPTFYRRPSLARRFPRQDYDMGAGYGSVGSGWRQGSVRLANGERRPARGGLARPVGVRRVATGHWARGHWCEGWGTDGRRDASASGPRGSHGRRARGVARRRRAAELWSVGSKPIPLILL
jgi:hypothetical protein